MIIGFEKSLTPFQSSVTSFRISMTLFTHEFMTFSPMNLSLTNILFFLLTVIYFLFRPFDFHTKPVSYRTTSLMHWYNIQYTCAIDRRTTIVYLIVAGWFILHSSFPSNCIDVCSFVCSSSCGTTLEWNEPNRTEPPPTRDNDNEWYCFLSTKPC